MQLESIWWPPCSVCVTFKEASHFAFEGGIEDRTQRPCTPVGACPSHLGFRRSCWHSWKIRRRWQKAQRGLFGHCVLAVTSTRCELAWGDTENPEDSGCLASRHISTSKLRPNLTRCPCSGSISLPVACTLPSDFIMIPPHPVSHLWAPKHWRLLSVWDSPCQG